MPIYGTCKVFVSESRLSIISGVTAKTYLGFEGAYRMPRMLPSQIKFGPKRAVFALGATLFLVACGGAGSAGTGAPENVLPPAKSGLGDLPPSSKPSSIVPPSPLVTSSASASRVPVQVTYVLPIKNNPTTSLLITPKSAKKRSLEYISTSNTKITVVVTPIGGAGIPFGPTACGGVQ